MARILRRRVVQMPKVASGRRNLASEINQWLKLGHNAQQIIEKMIPDDPTMSKGQMHELIRARFAGSDRAPGVGAQYLDKAVTGDMNRTGAPAVTAPVAAQDSIDEYVAAQGRLKGKVPTSSASVAAGDSSLTSAATPRTPPTPMGEVVEERIYSVDELPRYTDSPSTPLKNAAVRYATAVLTGEGDPDSLRAEVLASSAGWDTSPEQTAKGAIADAMKWLKDNAVEPSPSDPAPEAPIGEREATAKRAAKVLTEAPRAAQTVDEVIAMYDRLVEASGPRGFFENLGFGMADRMDAVNKAFMVNLSKSPLAQGRHWFTD